MHRYVHKHTRVCIRVCEHVPLRLELETASEAILRQTESNEGSYKLVREEECLGVEDKHIHFLIINSV